MHRCNKMFWRSFQSGEGEEKSFLTDDAIRHQAMNKPNIPGFYYGKLLICTAAAGDTNLRRR